MSGMVENRYRMDVVRRQGWSEEQFEVLAQALTSLMNAFDGGAWKGGSADQARQEFADMRGSLLSMIDYLRQYYAHTASTQPILVPDGTRESSWTSY